MPAVCAGEVQEPLGAFGFLSGFGRFGFHQGLSIGSQNMAPALRVHMDPLRVLVVVVFLGLRCWKGGGGL